MESASRPYPGTVVEFNAWFPDDAACLDYLTWLRWGDEGFCCHLCDAVGRGWLRGDSKSWDCGSCGSRTSAIAASWAGLTPKHHESDTTVRRGRITKQGSRLVRWAAVEAVQRAGEHTRVGAYRVRVSQRRGRNIGTVAAARELIECVYYALRDGTVRRLAAPA